MNLTLTQSLALQTKQHLDNAYQIEDTCAIHFGGRLRLLGVAVVGLVETAVRLVLFVLGHIAAVFSLYKSQEINQFIKEQTRAGFSSAMISSAGFFSLISPDLFREVSLPKAPNQEGVSQLPPPYNPDAMVLPSAPPEEPVVLIQEVAIEERTTNCIVDLVMLPFKMIAFLFKLTFYCIHWTFQLAVLPIRLALLPFEMCTGASSFQRPIELEYELDL